MFDLKQLLQTHERIKPFIHKTPLLTSENLNLLAGCSLYFKCENFQKVGAFKFRGATNAVLSLSPSEAEKGVVTHSSGNHAQALSLAAKNKHIPAYIVMPENAPQVKINAVKDYGAQITFCEPTLAARESTTESIINETDAYFIHPYNNLDIIKGQSTAAQEIYQEVSNLDYLIVPVGGGGLLSGSALANYYISPATKVIGAEPEGADDAYRSFKSGNLIPSTQPQTICDGLLTSLGDLTFPIIKEYVHNIITVSEKSIIRSMHLIWERMKIIIEPSAAVTLAVILENQPHFSNAKVGLILSGGNLDLNELPWQI